ncbi:hypothetical protein LRX75_21425 [Rhizobium sp. DKSPLA3]|uniref:Uncharacterized protein n=1 Tax=Rhizobium quercicola TaxID=2901226 RepID=A0A9X1NUS6_9HYPH|nr:hypothetical protein [Rhizobium quercicola]MCD7111600.1 hypothetical protein [Rhizobium quercicola]
MNIILGKYEVFKSVSLLIPQGERVIVPMEVDGWQLQVAISLIENGGPPSLDIEAVGSNIAQLTLRNWNNPLGTTTNQPASLGKSGKSGLDITFVLAHWRIGTVDKIEIQFMSAVQ